MAKTYDENLKFPKFRKLREEARLMVKQGKNAGAAYYILKHMDLEKDENDPFSVFAHPR